MFQLILEDRSDDVTDGRVKLGHVLEPDEGCTVTERELPGQFSRNCIDLLFLAKRYRQYHEGSSHSIDEKMVPIPCLKIKTLEVSS